MLQLPSLRIRSVGGVRRSVDPQMRRQVPSESAATLTLDCERYFGL
jgi:hypothetical protein